MNKENRRRAKNAETALDEYAKRDDLPGICPEHVTDILADLMHYCDERKLDFSGHLSSAENHYLEER